MDPKIKLLKIVAIGLIYGLAVNIVKRMWEE